MRPPTMVEILNETDAARYGEAFAYSTLLIVIVLIAIGLLTLAVGSRTGAEQRADIGGAAFG